MQKIKILFVYSTRGFAGLTRNIKIIIQNIDLERFEPTLVFIGDINDKAAQLEDVSRSRGISFYALDEKSKFNFDSIKQIQKIAKTYRSQIISCHGYKAKFYGAILSLYMPQKFASIAHGWVTPGIKIGIYYFLDKLVSHFYDKIILVAEGQRHQLKGFFLPKDKISVVNNGVCIEAFTADIEPLKNELFSKESLVVACVSRLSEEKNVRSTIKVFYTALKQNPNLILAIAGDGAEAESLKEYCKEIKIEKNIVFLGHILNPAGLYSIADIFVSSSLKEGLPNSLLEAQAFGLPCVVSKISGHTDVVIEGETGYLIDSNKIFDEFPKKLIKLSESEPLRRKLGAAARERIKKNFSVTKRMEKLESIYQDLIRVEGE